MIETLLMGLMASEMNNEVVRSNDANRFAEICNGSPMNAFEKAALMGAIGSIMSAASAPKAQAENNPIMGILGGVIGAMAAPAAAPAQSSENPIVGLIKGML